MPPEKPAVTTAGGVTGGERASLPGEGEATGVPPAGQKPGLRGKAFRDAVQAATSALHATQRRERGKYPAKGTTRKRYKPGMARRMPPPQPPGGTA